jgi:hypothetical protein
MSKQQSFRLRQFVGVVLIIFGGAAGFGSIGDARADDAIERGRALQSIALSLGCIVVGLILLFRKGKKENGTSDEEK